MTRIDINVAPGPVDPVATIGYLEAWADDPETFDGYLEHPDLPADKLVINGASEAWARYRVLRAYLDACLKEIDGTGGQVGGAQKFTILENSKLLAAVAEEMEAVLFQHVQAD
jgi:hypothetical protein